MDSPRVSSSDEERNARWTEDEASTMESQQELKLVIQNTGAKHGECSRVSQISQGIIASGIIATSLYFGTQILIGKKDPRVFCAWALLNGASCSVLFYTAVPKKIVRKVREFFLRWSYEIQFTAAQFDMNYAFSEARKYTAAGFVWAGSLLAAGDLYYFLQGRRRSEFPVASEPPLPGTKLVPTCTLESLLELNQRDPSIKEIKITLIVLNILRAAAVEGCYWSFRSRYTEYDEFSKVGFYAGLAHYYSGSELGEAFTRFIDDIRENAQRKFRAKQHTNSKEAPPFHLNVLNWFRNSLLPEGPYFSSLLLPFLIKPSNRGPLSDLEVAGIGCTMLLLFGAMRGALAYVERKEFENPLSTEHQIRKIEKEKLEDENLINTESKSRMQYVKELIYDYALSVFVLIALDIYMGVIYSTVYGTDVESLIGFPILALLLFSHCSFALAGFMREAYRPSPDSNRILNEIYFQVTRPTLWAMDYQFLRVHFRLDDKQLVSKSKQLFLGAMLGWACWGIAYGFHLSKFSVEWPHLTPGMTGVELGLVGAQAFKSRYNGTQ